MPDAISSSPSRQHRGSPRPAKGGSRGGRRRSFTCAPADWMCSMQTASEVLPPRAPSRPRRSPRRQIASFEPACSVALAPLLRVEEAPAVLDHLLHDRLQLGDGLVRVLEGEVAWRHRPYSRRLPVEPGGDLVGRRSRVPDFRAEPASRRHPLGPAGVHARCRVAGRRLGPLGQRLVPPNRRRRVRRDRGCGRGLLPVVPAARRTARPRAVRALRPGRRADLARRLPRRLRAAGPPCAAAPGE
jgi:hypothetical protein